MMSYSIIWYRELHRELWRKVKELIVADYEANGTTISYIDEYKELALEQLGYNIEDIECRCWACEQCKQQMIHEGKRLVFEEDGVDCDYCMFDWGNPNGCIDNRSTYWKLHNLLEESITDEEELSLVMKWCDEIINLPLRELKEE